MDKKKEREIRQRFLERLRQETAMGWFRRRRRRKAGFSRCWPDGGRPEKEELRTAKPSRALRVSRCWRKIIQDDWHKPKVDVPIYETSKHRLSRRINAQIHGIEKSRLIHSWHDVRSSTNQCGVQGYTREAGYKRHNTTIDASPSAFIHSNAVNLIDDRV